MGDPIKKRLPEESQFAFRLSLVGADPSKVRRFLKFNLKQPQIEATMNCLTPGETGKNTSALPNWLLRLARNVFG